MANKKGAKRRGVEFWRRAIERLQAGENAGDLAAELGVDRSGLYQWRARLASATPDPARQRQAAMSQKIEQLQRALAEKVLEVDFLQGALHKIEARQHFRLVQFRETPEFFFGGHPPFTYVVLESQLLGGLPRRPWRPNWYHHGTVRLAFS